MRWSSKDLLLRFAEVIGKLLGENTEVRVRFLMEGDTAKLLKEAINLGEGAEIQPHDDSKELCVELVSQRLKITEVKNHLDKLEEEMSAKGMIPKWEYGVTLILPDKKIGIYICVNPKFGELTINVHEEK